MLPSTAVQADISTTTAEQAARMTSALPLVGHIVRSVSARLPIHVDRGDLISAGTVALVLSAKRFEPERGIPFAHFAAIRIRGAIIDELRSMDWATRTVRGRARAAEDTADRLSATLGRTPTTLDIAGALGISPADLNQVNTNAHQAGVLSLQNIGSFGAEMVSHTAPGPESMLMQRETTGYLRDAVSELPERLRVVVAGYYLEQRLMSVIAVELGVTESRVSQLIAEALRWMRAGMSAQTEMRTEAPANSREGVRRAAYCAAIADRSSLSGRLALTGITGDVLHEALSA